MTETQRKALQAAEDAFRRYADHHAMRGDETKARANMALAGQMAAAQVECAAPDAAELAHRTCSRYKHDQNPALVEYTFNQHTLGDFARKMRGVTLRQTLTEAMQRMQAGEKLSYTDKEVELIMLGWRSELQKEVAAERLACKLICKEMEAAMTEAALIHPTDSPERDACYARARALMSAADAISSRGAA